MHEEKCQTTARKKRKTLYPHVILLVARLFWLAGIVFSLVLICWAVEDVIQNGLHFENGLMYSFLALIFILGGYAAFHLWPLIFGELTLTADYVKWHALFMRSVKIPYSELRHVEIRQFREGNVMWGSDMYHTGYEFVLMSADPLPKTRIDKIRPGHGVIKFQLFGRMNAPLGAFIPEPFDRMFRTRAEIYAREKRAMARDCRNGKQSAKRHAKSAGKSGRQKSKESMNRSGRC